MIYPRDTEEACPSCGRYYVLTITAPPLPGYLADYGTDEQIEAWEEDHDYDILEGNAALWGSMEKGITHGS